jgi:hypothetical protein
MTGAEGCRRHDGNPYQDRYGDKAGSQPPTLPTLSRFLEEELSLIGFSQMRRDVGDRHFGPGNELRTELL